MKLFECILVLAILLNTPRIYAQETGPNFIDSDFLETVDDQFQSSAKDSLFLWQENVVLQLDKGLVSRKDRIFFKAYVLTGPNQLRVSTSNVLKVELLSKEGKLLKRQYHKINSGTSEGVFEIPKTTEKGTHYLRAYTKWMMNYGPDNFAITTVEVSKSKGSKTTDISAPLEMNFFPEGGKLISGLRNKLAITGLSSITDQYRIVDNLGNQVALVTNYLQSIGTAIFTPQKNRTYFLVSDQGLKKQLPKPADLGFTISLNNVGKESSHVRVGASTELLNEKVFLRGTSNGVTYFEKEVDFKSSNEVEIEIPKTNIPNGILKFTLIDEFDQIWAERSMLIEKDKLNVTIEPYESTVNEKEFKLAVTDSEGTPVKSEFSISVVTQREDGKNNLFSEPNNLRSQRFLQDLKVLTNQFYDGKKPSTSKELPSTIYYNFQKGLEFYGQAYDLENTLLTNTKIQLLITTNDDAIVKEVMTDSDGMLKITDLQIQGKAEIVFRTIGEETKERLVKVIPYDFETPPISGNSESWERYLKSRQNFRNNADHLKNNKGTERLIALKEVTVTEDKGEKRLTPPVYGIRAPRKSVVVQDPKKPKLFSELFLGLPGTIVVGSIDAPAISSVRITGSGVGGAPNGLGSLLSQSGPLWVVDGMIYGNSPRLDPTWGITHIDVDRIEFINPSNPDASMWGSRAAFGVILIYTRNGSDFAHFNRRKAQLTYQGFEENPDFETYQSQLSTREKENDQVLYWNPSLKTNENGEATIKIKLPEEATKIKIEALTITPKGQKGILRYTF